MFRHPPHFAALITLLLAASAFADPSVETTGRAEALIAEVHMPVSVTFLPGISTNGLTASNVVNNFSLGLLATHAGRVNGVALSSGLNLTERRSRAALLAAVGNISQQGFLGTQLGGAFNVSGVDSRGFQAAGAVNISTGHFTGLQTSGAVNLASGLRGAQLSVVNIADDVDGAQIGVINIARKVRGLQLGVVNLAGELEGAPIGLVSIAKNGQFHLQAFATDVALTNVALKYGGRHVHSLFILGVQPGDEENRRWSYGFGLGGHIPLDRFYVDVDAIASSVHRQVEFDGNANVLAQLRAVVGFSFAQRLSIFAGVTGNTFVDWNAAQPLGQMKGLPFAPRFERQGAYNSVQVWPGLVAGVQI